MFIRVFQAFVSDGFLTRFTLAPPFFRHFIASDMDKCRRKQCGDFLQYIFHKRKCKIIANAHHVFVYTPHFHGHFISRAGASQLRVCRQCRLSMSRHVYFRDDSNISLGSIRNNLFYLLLSIVAPVIVRPSPGTGLSQVRILLTLDSPSLVVCQMPVEMIQAMKRQQIDIALYLRNRKEMAADIEHGSPVRKRRIILQFHRRDTQLLFPACLFCLTVL